MSKTICVFVLTMAAVCGAAANANASAQSNEALAQSKQALMPAAADVPCAFTINYGSGAMQMNSCISDVGRVTQFTWNGQNMLLSGHYLLCDPTPLTYTGYTFIPVSFFQPNGPGTSPLTVIANSADNAWQVKHVFTLNKTELELTDAATVKRLGGAIGPNPTYFAVAADTAVNSGDMNDVGIASHDTVAVTDVIGLDGLNLMAITRTTAHTTAVNSYYPAISQCNPLSGGNPFGPADMGFNVTYRLGSFNTNASKTVKFKWGKQ